MYLWNDGDSWSQIFKAKLWDIHAIDKDGATCRLNNPKQCKCERRLTSSSATNDTNLGKGESSKT